MRFDKKENKSVEELKAKIEEMADFSLPVCYQCGKCTAGCPMAEEMDIKPNQVIRLINMGQFDTVLNCKAIWNCISCETCTTRCPQELDPAALMDALRMLSKAKDYDGANNSVEKFNKIFLWIVKTCGRLYEPGLVGSFNLLSGNLFKDVFDLAPSMFFKGKLNLIPQRIGDLSELQRMIEKCEKYAEEERAEKK